MKTILTSCVVLLCLSGISSHVLHCQGHEPVRALTEYIDFKLQRDHIPGLAVCLVKEGKIVWSRGFGFQNLDARVPMSPQSVVGTASITKLITAIAIMQLSERKKLDLDDPINKYLPFRIEHPKFPNVDITISQLLNHTASTSNGPSLWRGFSCDAQPLSKKKWTEAYFLPGGKFFHKEGNFGDDRPGEKFLYSNAGYALLAYLVEIVSGVPFEKYCAENIFTPLKMTNTSFDAAGIQKGTLSTRYSYGYNMDLERDLMAPETDCGKAVNGDYFFRLCNYTTTTLGAGGMYSSVEQLTHLLSALMNGRTFEGNVILSKQSVGRMLSHAVDADLLPGQFAAFGLGAYAMRLSNGAHVWGHTGADPGESSFMLFNAETGIGAIVLANRWVDIRDLIEWSFAEGIAQYSSTPLEQLGGIWRPYLKGQTQHKVTVRVVPNYLPGGSHLRVIGNHRYLGGWVSTGIPLVPQKDRSWEATFLFPDSTKLEFKVTRGDMKTQAVRMDGKIPPNHSFVVTKDTVYSITVEDWKDQAQQ